MRDYVSLLQARYERFTWQSSQADSRTYVQGGPSDPAVLTHVKAAATDWQGHAQVPHVQLEGGEVSEEGGDIMRVFKEYFERMFTSERAALDDAGGDFGGCLRKFSGRPSLRAQGVSH